MERRQVIGAIAAPSITVGAAAVIAALNKVGSPEVQERLLIGGAIGFVFGLLLLAYLLFSAKPKAAEPGGATITSHGQSGGITAHTVNTGKTDV